MAVAQPCLHRGADDNLIAPLWGLQSQGWMRERRAGGAGIGSRAGGAVGESRGTAGRAEEPVQSCVCSSACPNSRSEPWMSRPGEW